MMPDDLMQECMRTLHSRAAQEYHTSWPDLAEILGVNGATARKIVASLRRRGFVAAPGLYPTALGMREWTTLPENSSRWKIMRLVVENWLNPSEPAITLTTLERTLDASRSTINLSIVRLRDMNYLEPRGTIVPTGVWND
jgi:predicted transcriptional regulator